MIHVGMCYKKVEMGFFWPSCTSSSVLYEVMSYMLYNNVYFHQREVTEAYFATEK